VFPAFAAALAGAPPAAAQLTVFDPANYQQNLASAARGLEQVNNQLRTLEGQAQMLARLDRNLAPLAGSIVPDLKRRLIALEGQLTEGGGMALGRDGNVVRLFSGADPSARLGEARSDQTDARWGQTYASVERAARLQGEVGDGLAGDSRLLGEALDRSRAATGALEVAQAGNELSGLGVKQALALESLLAAQHRAETLKSARELVDEAEARQRFKRFLGSSVAVGGTP